MAATIALTIHFLGRPYSTARFAGAVNRSRGESLRIGSRTTRRISSRISGTAPRRQQVLFVGVDRLRGKTPLAPHDRPQLVQCAEHALGDDRIGDRLVDVFVAAVKAEVAARGVAAVVDEELAFQPRGLVVDQFQRRERRRLRAAEGLGRGPSTRCSPRRRSPADRAPGGARRG